MSTSSSPDQPESQAKHSLFWTIGVLSFFLVIGTIIFGALSLFILTFLFVAIFGSPLPQVINIVVVAVSLLLGIFLSLRFGVWFVSARSIFSSAQIRQIVLSLVGVFVGIFILLSILFEVLEGDFSSFDLLMDLVILVIGSAMIYLFGTSWLRKREVEPLPKKKRGIWLTLWLILLLLGNLQTSIVLPLNFRVISQIVPDLAGRIVWIIYAMSFIAFLNVVFLIFLFRWKKWAFYALCSGYFLFFVMMMIASPLGALYFGPLAALTLGITYLSLRSRWQFLE